MRKFSLSIVDTIDTQDYHLARLRSLGDLEVHIDVPTPDQLVTRLSTCEIAVLGWSKVTRDVLDACPNLKLISLWSTGFDYVDVKYASERNIVVTNVPGYAAETISEFVVASLILLARRIPAAHQHVLAQGFDWKQFRGTEVRGKTLGIIGTGAIGCAVAMRARALGMNVIAFTRNPSAEKAKSTGLKYVSLNELLQTSDAISIHASLNDTTRGMIADPEFSQMKHGVTIVNTARGEIIDTSALERALEAGIVSGACLDVISPKPIPADSLLCRHPNVVLTPHYAFHTVEALRLKTDICVRNVERFVVGQPENVIRV